MTQFASNWTATVPENKEAGCLAAGKLWVCSGGSVYGYDMLTGSQATQFSGFGQGAEPRMIQGWRHGLIVYCTDKKVYVINIDRVSMNPSVIQVIDLHQEASWLHVNGDVVFLAGDMKPGEIWLGRMQASPGEDQLNPQIRYASFSELSGPLSAGSRFLYLPFAGNSPRVQGVLQYWDPDTSVWPNKAWNRSITAQVVGPMASNLSALCFATADNMVHCVWDDSADVIVWQVLLPNAAGVLHANQQYCYVAAGNQIHVLDISNGTTVRAVTLESKPRGGILVGDDMLCVADDQHVYAIKVSTGQVAECATKGTPFLAGIEDGFLYFGARQRLYARRLTDLFLEFYAEGVLIQDFDFSNAAAPQTPAFHTEITLLGLGGSPCGNQEIRLTATSPTTITWGGKDYEVDATKSAQLSTDAAGKIRIGSRTGDRDTNGEFHHGLLTPGLVLWSNSMGEGRTKLIRPDEALHHRLATITQSELGSTIGYDKKPLVSDQFRTNDKVMSVATRAVNSIAGMVKQPAGTGPHSSDIFLESRGGDARLDEICCCHDREHNFKLVCDQSYSFDLAGNGCHFEFLSATEAEQQFQARQHLLGGQNMLESNWFSDLWEAIKKGAAKVVNAVVTVAQKVVDGVKAVVTAVIDGIEKIFNVVIDSIGKAMTFIAGVFNQIAGSIKRTIEAFSHIFDWARMVEVHTYIANQIKGAWTALITPRPGDNETLLEHARKKVNADFVDLKKKADDSFGELKKQLGVKTAAGERKSGGSGNPDAGGAKSNWLQSRVQDHALSENAVSAPASSNSLIFPELTVDDSIKGEFTRLLDGLSGAVSTEFDATIARIRKDLESPDQIWTAALSIFVDIVQGVVDVTIKIAQVVLDGVIGLLGKLIKALLKLVTDPITIPFVSKFYKWATNGSDLTLLSLFSLLAAVPVVIAEGLAQTKFFPSTSAHEVPTEHVDPGVLKGFNIAGGVLQTLWGGFAALIGVLSLRPQVGNNPVFPFIEQSRVLFGIGGFFIVRGILSIPMVMAWISNDTSFDLPHLLLWLFPTLLVAASTVALLARATKLLPIFSFVCGALVLISLAVGVSLKILKEPFAIAFAALVGSGLIILVATLSPTLNVKIPVVLLSGALIAASGVVKVVGAALA